MPNRVLCQTGLRASIVLSTVIRYLKEIYIGMMLLINLSYDVASGNAITPCNKIDKPLVVYRFLGNLMTFITTLCT